MELTYECPNCSTVNRVGRVEDEYHATCTSCGATRELHRTASKTDGLTACVWCSTHDLYIQKDFPHNLGLGIVIAGFVLSTVFWAMYQPVWAFAVLLLTAAVDVVLYYLVPDVTICYRCLGQHRGPGSNPGNRFAPFDLAIGERYPARADPRGGAAGRTFAIVLLSVERDHSPFRPCQAVPPGTS